jgi:hypothetical protein
MPHRLPLLVSTLALFFCCRTAFAEEGKEAKLEGKHQCFEMRTYTAADGKLDALHARFRDHTNKLFLKHGMDIVGFWVPSEGDKSKNTLVYVLAYPDRAARDKMWKAFQEDPDWKAARTESEKNGKLVEHVESVFMTPTDYSPIK